MTPVLMKVALSGRNRYQANTISVKIKLHEAFSRKIYGIMKMRFDLAKKIKERSELSYAL